MGEAIILESRQIVRELNKWAEEAVQGENRVLHMYGGIELGKTTEALKLGRKYFDKQIRISTYGMNILQAAKIHYDISMADAISMIYKVSNETQGLAAEPQDEELMEKLEDMEGFEDEPNNLVIIDLDYRDDLFPAISIANNIRSSVIIINDYRGESAKAVLDDEIKKPIKHIVFKPYNRKEFMDEGRRLGLSAGLLSKQYEGVGGYPRCIKSYISKMPKIIETVGGVQNRDELKATITKVKNRNNYRWNINTVLKTIENRLIQLLYTKYGIKSVHGLDMSIILEGWRTTEDMAKQNKIAAIAHIERNLRKLGYDIKENDIESEKDITAIKVIKALIDLGVIQEEDDYYHIDINIAKYSATAEYLRNQ